MAYMIALKPFTQGKERGLGQSEVVLSVIKMVTIVNEQKEQLISMTSYMFYPISPGNRITGRISEIILEGATE